VLNEDKDSILGEIMKKSVLKVFLACVATLGLMFVDSASAQNVSTETAVLAVCKALGGKAGAEKTAIGCLDRLNADDVLGSFVYTTLVLYINKNYTMSQILFGSFLADIFTGKGKLPENVDSARKVQAFLASKGIELGTTNASIDAETLAGIITGANSEISAGYRAALSGTAR
jgi:hypothetical protein